MVSENDFMVGSPRSNCRCTSHPGAVFASGITMLHGLSGSLSVGFQLVTLCTVNGLSGTPKSFGSHMVTLKA